MDRFEVFRFDHVGSDPAVLVQLEGNLTHEVLDEPGVLVGTLGDVFFVRALEEALAGDKKIFLATQHDASVDEPRPDEIFSVGTVVNIVQSLKLPDGNIKVLVEGVERARIEGYSNRTDFFEAQTRALASELGEAQETEALAAKLSVECRQRSQGACCPADAWLGATHRRTGHHCSTCCAVI